MEGVGGGATSYCRLALHVISVLYLKDGQGVLNESVCSIWQMESRQLLPKTQAEFCLNLDVNV